MSETTNTSTPRTLAQRLHDASIRFEGREPSGILCAAGDKIIQLEHDLAKLTLAHQSSVAAGLELKRQRDELAATLRLLHDYQNGCLLPKYEPYWKKAMADAEKLLDELGK